MKILKDTKNEGFILSLDNRFFKKPQRKRWGVGSIDPPRRFRVKFSVYNFRMRENDNILSKVKLEYCFLGNI